MFFLDRVSKLPATKGPAEWAWVRLGQVADALHISPAELLENFAGARETLTVWDGIHCHRLSVDGGGSMLIDSPWGKHVISTQKIGEWLRRRRNPMVPLGWAKQVARLKDSGVKSIEVVEYDDFDRDPPAHAIWAWELHWNYYRAAFPVTA